MAMESAVALLERAGKEASESLDDIEHKILLASPAAKPLLDLCTRLRLAKSRLLTVKTNITHLLAAQDQLKQNLAQYLVPAADTVKGACLARNVSAPRIVFASPPPDQALTYVSPPVAPPAPVLRPTAEKKAPAPSLPKQSRHISPRPAKAHIAPPPTKDRFADITDEEFRQLDTRAFGNITLGDVRDTYRLIWNYFKQQGDKSVILTTKAMSELGAKMGSLLRVLKFLKSLRRIALTKDDNVRWIEQ
jgi:hypothetical protein